MDTEDFEDTWGWRYQERCDGSFLETFWVEGEKGKVFFSGWNCEGFKLHTD